MTWRRKRKLKSISVIKTVRRSVSAAATEKGATENVSRM